MATPSSTNVNPPATQLYNDHQKIPEDFPHLDDAPDRLQGLYDYDSWSFFIKSTLKSAGLKQFTHICTRPPLSDPSYGLWRRTSLRVTNWLVHQLSSDFLSRLVAFKRAQANSRPQTSSSSSSRFPPNFADTMWTTIRRVALHQIPGEQAQSCEEAYLRCIHANRVGYPLARTFVNDF